MNNIKIGIIQRVLTPYRKPFFDKLADTSNVSLSIFAGMPLENEGIAVISSLDKAKLYNAKNKYFRIRGEHLCWQIGLRKWLSEFNPDILIVEANPRLISTSIAIRYMKKNQKPILGWGLGELNRTGISIKVKIREKIARNMYRKMNGMIAYSSKGKRDYIQAGIQEESIYVAFNAINNNESEMYLRMFEKQENWLPQWKLNEKLNVKLPIILFVGRLIKEKSLDILIKAFSKVSSEAHLIIVGDGPVKEELENLAKDIINIKFLGHKTGEELAKIFIASDCFVLPGSGGLALHQAMSYGKPVIVAYGDGTEEDLVFHDVNGFFVEAGNIETLYEKLKFMIENKILMNRMGQASLKIIKNEKGIDSMVNVFLNVINVFLKTNLKIKGTHDE